MSAAIIEATVAGEIFIPLDSLHPQSVDELRAELRFENPKYKSSQIFGGKPGLFDRYIDTARLVPKGMYMPRGAVRLLTEAAQSRGQSVTFTDRRATSDSCGFTHTLERLHGKGARLYPFQETASGGLVRHVQSCIVAPCGGGKTVIGLHAVANADQRTLILVHTKDLLAQWTGEVIQQLGVIPSVFGARKREFGTVTIAIVQALTRAIRRGDIQILSELARFGTVLLDEAHHVPAATFLEVIGHVPAKNRFGLTATPNREDGLGPLVELVMGQIVWQTTFDELAQGGYLMRATIYEVATGRNFAWCADYRALINGIVADTQRSQDIVDACGRQARQGRTILAISEDRDHVEEICLMAKAKGIRAEFVHGKVGDLKRNDRITAIIKGEISMLVATKVADEGLNIPRLDTLHLMTPKRSRAVATQRAGRTMRLFKGKETAEVYEWVDEHKTARNQWIYRRAGYRKFIGKDCVHKHVLNPQDVGRVFQGGLTLG